ncbi:MAG TPA: ribonuclease H-like domain-containing protein [Nitrospira sp.]|nr:ribonuclease H-like domain-containing protein [Nitrospira sp.]
MKIVLDIETLQASEGEWAYLQGIASAEEAMHIDPTLIATQFAKEYEKSRFDGTFSRIICMGILVVEDSFSPVEAIAWCGNDETAILRNFWSKMARINPVQVIVHNGLGFDLPFILKRSIIRNVRPTVDIALTRFRTTPVFDTMAVWANWDPRAFIKLDVLARALAVESKSGSGDQVAKMWDEGLYADIARYCLQDTHVTYCCYCRMNFREISGCISVLNNSSIHIVGESVNATSARTLVGTIR